MATLTKVSSGYLFEDDFASSNLLWNLSPNDYSRVVFEAGYVGLEHGEERLTMSIPTPSHDYVMQAQIYHNPETLSDVSGLVVLSNTGNQIECQHYFTGAKELSLFRYIKLCVEKGVHTFCISRDGLTWVNAGNSEMNDANEVGFFIDGVQTYVSDMLRVLGVSFYKSNLLSVNNVPSDATVRIYDQNGVNVLANQDAVKNSNGKALVDLTTVLLPLTSARLSVVGADGIEIGGLEDVTLCGGDVYDYAYNVEVLIAEQAVLNANIFDLGRVTGKETVLPVTIISREAEPLRGIALSVAPVSYYRGGDQVTLAFASDTPTYQTKLELPDLLPNVSYDFLIKIDRDITQFGPAFADSYRFKIILE